MASSLGSGGVGVSGMAITAEAGSSSRVSTPNNGTTPDVPPSLSQASGSICYPVSIPREHQEWPECDLSPLEAEEHLTLFRTKLLPSFPILYFHPAVNAQTLRQELPVLWQCIISLTTKSMPRKFGLGDAIRRHFAERILVGGEGSLDLLLGCLCFIGW